VDAGGSEAGASVEPTGRPQSAVSTMSNAGKGHDGAMRGNTASMVHSSSKEKCTIGNRHSY